MTLGELRQRLRHIPDNWKICWLDDFGKEHSLDFDDLTVNKKKQHIAVNSRLNIYPEPD